MHFEGQTKLDEQFSKCDPQMAASASPGSFLEMLIFGPHPGPAEIRNSGGGAQHIVFSQALQATLIHPLVLMGKPRPNEGSEPAQGRGVNR